MEHTSNEGYKFHYANYGDDWSQIEGLAAEDNMCGLDNQSPINLLREGDPGFDWKIYESKDDELTKNYVNQLDATVKVTTLSPPDTTKVPLTTEVNTANTFTSKLASSVFGTGVTWDGLQFHMHAGSEHTINGKRYDLEMHTVHVPDG